MGERKVEQGNLILGNLTSFFINKPDALKTFSSIVNGTSPLSLRLIDFFVTHYARHYNTVYWINEKTGLTVTSPNINQLSSLTRFNVYLAYSTQLKAYTKLHFDPFRRHQRVSFKVNDEPLTVIETTVGQLNFFKWAFTNNIINYIESHIGEIETAMSNTLGSIKKRGKTLSSTGGDNITETKNSNVVKINSHCYLKFD